MKIRASLNVYSPKTELIAIGVFSLALLGALYATNSNWMYTPIGWIDAWYHVGYGLYFNHADFLNDYYKVSRLPWNLYEFAVRGLLRPIPAAITIQFSMYAASSVLAYYSIASLAGRPAAILVAYLIAASPLLHDNGGADYPTQMAGPLFFAAIAAIVWASRSPLATARYIAIGALTACLLYTFDAYLFVMPFVLALAATLPVFTANVRIPGIISRFIFGVFGAGIATVILCAINAAFGRGWLFFMPDVQYSLKMAAHGVPTQYAAWNLSWLLQSDYLGFIFGVAAIACIDGMRIVISGKAREERIALTIHILYVAEVVLWGALQTLGQPMFTPGYVAYPLYGPMFLSLGAAIAPRLTERVWILAGLLGCAPILFYFALRDDGTLYGSVQHVLANAFTIAAVCTTCFYVALLIIPRGAPATVFALLALPFVNGANSSPQGYAPTSCRVTEWAYVAIVDNSLALTNVIGDPARVFMWTDGREPLPLPKGCDSVGPVGYVGVSFASLGHSYVLDPWTPAPNPTSVPLNNITAIAANDNLIAAITFDRSKAWKLAARFAAAGKPIYYVGVLLPPVGNPMPPFYIFRTRPLTARQ